MMWGRFEMGCKDKVFQCENPTVNRTTAVGFTKVTEESGLQDISAMGTRISAMDFALCAAFEGTVCVRCPDALLIEEIHLFTGNQLMNMMQGEELDAP